MDPVRFIAKLFSRWRSAFSPSPEEDARHVLGRHGEKIAAQYLRQQRYKVLYRNFRAHRGGEVDLVCREGDTLVFVEVKTRSSDLYGRPAEAVNREKQALIARGALAWLRLLDNPELVFRFDIVEIVLQEGKPVFNLIRNAFPLPGRSPY